MPTVVGVRLRFSKTLWFDPAGSEPQEGDTVLVDTERGTEVGMVTQPPHELSAEQLSAPLKPILRVADANDLAKLVELEEQERETMAGFREMVEAHGLDMKPVDVEYLIGGDKIVFYFSAEERVDFRNLVRELAARYHARIDMRQVGVRDEARAVGGVGHCGQMLCCVRLGNDFQPVSIRMAKEQDLPLNPLKISGLCGRLMCCLRYEFDAYKDYKSRAPRRGAMIETPGGEGKVTDLNTPKETVTMRLEGGNTITVPLAGMTCAKGSGCPCSVSAEAFEKATGPTTPVLTLPDIELSGGTSARTAEKDTPSEKAEGSSSNRRRRRRGKKSEGGSESAAQGGQAKPQQGGQQQKGSASKQPKQSRGGGQKSPKVPRRGAGSGEGQKPSSGGAAQGAGGSAAEDGGRTPRRRRRRRPGAGGGESGSGTESP